MRREPAEHGREAVAALDPPAQRLRIKTCGEMVAGKGKAIRRHPMIGEREGRGEIGRARARCTVNARLKGIALAAASSVLNDSVSQRSGRGSKAAPASGKVAQGFLSRDSIPRPRHSLRAAVPPTRPLAPRYSA